MSSSICPHFMQNAWKKDLCSNCFKSKDEHNQSRALNGSSRFATFSTRHNAVTSDSHIMEQRKIDYPNKDKSPQKGIIKKGNIFEKNSTKNKVTFPKQLFEVIGHGGDWSDVDSGTDDDDEFFKIESDRNELAAGSTDDEETLELKRITQANTDFNMNNGNLLGDPQDNIKKSFAALKLGAPQVDKEGKKQTLKINVVPFGAAPTTTTISRGSSSITSPLDSLTATAMKPQFDKIEQTKQTNLFPKTNAEKTVVTKSLKNAEKTPSTQACPTPSSLYSLKSEVVSGSDSSDGKNSPPIERAMEKSLLDEISETLEQQKQSNTKKLTDNSEPVPPPTTTSHNPLTKIKFEISAMSEALEQKPCLDLKKPIARNAPISKDTAKPKINVFHKYSDSESIASDGENGVSAYYDVVETEISYENLPDGKYTDGKNKAGDDNEALSMRSLDSKPSNPSMNEIADILLSSKTRGASYTLPEGQFMTSTITSDGLVVTKRSSDDALDSMGSSFDGSSDDEASYNMIRSESDSGIGISVGRDYKNIVERANNDLMRKRMETKLSLSTNTSDYEDIQVSDQASVVARSKKPIQTKPPRPFALEKCRELHGQPDGSADPDGLLEQIGSPSQLPSLPKSPPPTKVVDSRPSFLHGVQKTQYAALKKPELPVKPLVSPNSSTMKSFFTKMSTNLAANTEGSVDKQKVSHQLHNAMSPDQASADAKLKKARAPNPPPDTKSSAPTTPERDYNVNDFFVEKENSTDQTKAVSKQLIAELKANEKRIQIGDNNTSTTASSEKAVKSLGSSDIVSTKTQVASGASPGASSSKFTRKSYADSPRSSESPINTAESTNNNNLVSKSNPAAPTVREKEKRERAIVNPKFRSLNNFVMQRNQVTKNIQLQSSTTSLSLKPMTPELKPRSYKNQLSLSEECLAEVDYSPSNMSVSTANLNLQMPGGGDKSKTSLPTFSKAKSKFSIKKFLRMGGAGKTADNLHNKKDSTYSEICTGEDYNVVGKPRLVIIHPIDINTAAVEVVKGIAQSSEAVVNAQTVAAAPVTGKPPEVTAKSAAVTAGKPPAPPVRASEGQRSHEANKPARPPPPKSAELRRKQKIGLSPTASIDSEMSGSLKCKADNVYANLGEIRSSIAPRKPERTASMREREAQLELARQRHVGTSGIDCVDTISICSSNGDNVSSNSKSAKPAQSSKFDSKPMESATGNRSDQRSDRKNESKKAPIYNNKLEVFESRGPTNSTSSTINSTKLDLPPIGDSRPSSLKDSVRKINSTIDSYLKDKREYENMYEDVKGPSSTATTPPTRTTTDFVSGSGQMPPHRNNLYSDTASIASFTRSEYGPPRTSAVNNSLANIPRVISASCCGSEMGEFDIYSPYSYYGSETGGDVANDINDSVWGVPSAIRNRLKATNRLRMRKGRSVVHKTIEDNYTAVVVANHEALAQVLDQLEQTPVIPPTLRPLANAMNLRFEDFTIIDGAQAFVVGKKAFHAAIWNSAPVTLALSADSNQLSGVGGELNQLSGGVSGVLNPITEFCDLVQCYYLPLMPSTEVTMLQATISVLPRLQLETLQTIGAILKNKSQMLDKSNFNFRGSIPNLAAGGSLKDNSPNIIRNVMSVQNLTTLNEEGEKLSSFKVVNTEKSSPPVVAPQSCMPSFDDVMTREVAFIMLQLVNGMKNLQVKAIEEMPLTLSNVVLSKDIDNKESQARLCVLQGNHNYEEDAMGTLCHCAYIALNDMLPSTMVTGILSDILKQERSESLSKAKSVLEFILWGPSDVILTGSTKERESALQRWLDLERATVLHGLVRTRIELTVYDECHLMFLVRSTAKIMNDAAKILYSYQKQVT